MTRFSPSWPMLAITALLLLIIAAQRVSRPPVIVAAPPADTLTVAPVTPTPDVVLNPTWPDQVKPLEPAYLLKSPLLHTEIPRRPRKEVVSYRVGGGDTILGIAFKFGISGETVLWANERVELSPDFLRIGQQLIIPPTTGVLHEVKSGDTVDALAKKYKVDAAAIMGFEYNFLTPPYTLMPGQKVMVPGGDKPYQPKVVYGYSGPVPENASKGSGNFVWPISGLVTQIFWTGHRGIDISARPGNTVVAADGGYVVHVGRDNGGYGNHLMINHGNGYETLYAHLSVILVEPGQSVRRGQPIGLSGNSGHSTGPHLHFELRQYGVQRNPFNFLP